MSGQCRLWQGPGLLWVKPDEGANSGKYTLAHISLGECPVVPMYIRTTIPNTSERDATFQTGMRGAGSRLTVLSPGQRTHVHTHPVVTVNRQWIHTQTLVVPGGDSRKNSGHVVDVHVYRRDDVESPTSRFFGRIFYTSGTPLIQTPMGQKEVSISMRCPFSRG